MDELTTRIVDQVKSELRSSTPTLPKETKGDFLTVKQVAELLGVSLVTVHKWKKDGKLKFHRFGTRIRFDRNEILNVGKLGKI